MTTQDLPDYAQAVAPAAPGISTDELSAVITASAAGATQVVAGVASKRVVVLAYVVTANAEVNVKFQSATAPTDLTGLLYHADKGGEVVPYCATGWFAALSGEALNINLSGAAAVGGHIKYALVSV